MLVFIKQLDLLWISVVDLLDTFLFLSELRLQHSLGLLLNLFFQPLVVVLHNGLHCDCGSKQVPESCHPHVAVVQRLGTQQEQSFAGLQVKHVLPA